MNAVLLQGVSWSLSSDFPCRSGKPGFRPPRIGRRPVGQDGGIACRPRRRARRPVTLAARRANRQEARRTGPPLAESYPAADLCCNPAGAGSLPGQHHLAVGGDGGRERDRGGGIGAEPAE